MSRARSSAPIPDTPIKKTSTVNAAVRTGQVRYLNDPSETILEVRCDNCETAGPPLLITFPRYDQAPSWPIQPMPDGVVVNHVGSRAAVERPAPRIQRPRPPCIV